MIARSNKPTDSAHWEGHFPDYQIVENLAQGGQGIVWKALRKVDGRKVAIKVIHARHAAESDARARFVQECKTLSRLDHPGIVRVIDYGETTEKELWLITDFIPGVPVNQFIERLDHAASIAARSIGEHTRTSNSRLWRIASRQLPTSPFPLRETLQLFTKICDALEAAHNAGVVHRDLKPSNILVDEAGTPYVLDFGLAKLPASYNPEAVTLTQQYLGSPAWSAPEQVQGSPNLVDARTDVYSLGILLYRLLTGTFPYSVEGQFADIFDNIRHASPLPPRQHVTFIDQDLEAVILKCLSKQREDRYATAGRLAEDLARCLAGRKPLARAGTPKLALRRMIRRHPLASTGSIVAVACSVIYVAAITHLYQKERLAAKSAHQALQSAQRALGYTIDQVTENLKDVAGARPIREAIIRNTSVELMALTKEHSKVPVLQDIMAEAHRQLGDVLLSVGNLDSAMEHRQALLTIRERLAKEQPTDPRQRRELALSFVLIGDIEKERASGASAMDWYSKAHAIFLDLSQTQPTQEIFLDDLSWSYERLGVQALHSGNWDRAEKLFHQRYAIAQQLVNAAPDNETRLEGLHAALYWLRNVDSKRGKPVEAHFQEAAEIGVIESRYARDPLNPRFALAMAFEQGDAISRALDEHDHSTAQKLLRSVSPIVQSLNADDSESLNHRYLKSATDAQWGRLYFDRGEIEIAYQRLKAAYEFRRQQVDEFPHDSFKCEELLTVLHFLSNAAKYSGRADEAASRFKEGNELADRIASISPDHSTRLCTSAMWLGRCQYNDECDPERGIQLAERAAEIQPENAEVWVSLVEIYEANNCYKSAVEAADMALAKAAREESKHRRTLEFRRDRCLQALASQE